MIRNILTEVDKKFGNYNCGICTATGNYIADEFPPERSSRRKKRTKLFPRLGMAGQNLRGCILQNCISVHPESEIWLASDEFHQSVAVKITKRTMDIGIIKKISELQSEYLVPVLDYGFCEESFYEIMPYYRNGSIENCTDQ